MTILNVKRMQTFLRASPVHAAGAVMAGRFTTVRRSRSIVVGSLFLKVLTRVEDDRPRSRTS